MYQTKLKFNRRDFMKTAGAAAATFAYTANGKLFAKTDKKRVALVGTGIRGTGFWGRNLKEKYSDILEFVGLCDINPGRLEFGKKFIDVNCPHTLFILFLPTTAKDLYWILGHNYLKSIIN